MGVKVMNENEEIQNLISGVYESERLGEGLERKVSENRNSVFPI